MASARSGSSTPGRVPRPGRPGPELPAGPEPAPPSPSATAASTLLAGRYRLSTRVGSDTAAGAEFWRAQDTVLQRDVAVSVLRRLGRDSAGGDDPTGAARAGEMVVRALRSGSFEHDGCARLLDVLTSEGARIPDDVLGAAVTEWVPGRSLAELIADGMIRPLAAARAVAPLAAAAEQAHRHGLVLGCDHPQRIRITPDGRAQLCFVLPRPDVTPADDVRGLGAVLYALLTSRWPLSRADAARAGLAPAELTSRGTFSAPSLLRPGVPMELDTLVLGTLGPPDAPGHVRTAAAVHRLLGEAVAEDDRIALFPPAHDGVPSEPRRRVAGQQPPGPAARPAAQAQPHIGLAALGSAVLVVLGYLGLQLSSVFSEGGRPAIVVAGRRPPEQKPARAPPTPPAATRRPPRRPRPGVGRPPPPAWRSTTTAATGTTPAGSPG